MMKSRISTGYGDDYTTGCLIDYACFKDNYRLIAVDLTKQKALDADPRTIQQIEREGVVGEDANTKIRLYTILAKIKRNNIRIFGRISKSSVVNTNG